MIIVETPRLLLGTWEETDRAPFAALNADPEVMAFFPGTLGRERSDDLVTRLQSAFEHHGCTFYAARLRTTGAFVGFVGLLPVPETLPFGPTTEIGWRLARHAWGQGLATEAASACLDLGFGSLGREEIVAYAVAGNRRSRAVMERLGMDTDPSEDFDHPALPAESPLRRHVLYRIKGADWRARRKGRPEAAL